MEHETTINHENGNDVKPLVSGSNLFKGMNLLDNKNKKWNVINCEDLHNVHLIKEGEGLLINVDGKDIECGGSDLCCFVENCTEFLENRPLYYHH